MIRPTASLFVGLVVSLLSTTMGWAEPELPAVLFEQPSHFTAPDGVDVLVAPGTYRVEQSTETQLRLVADPGQPTIEIQATATSHKETLAAPLALAIAEEDRADEVHLVLLLPDGQGLDATGSLSGTRSRATRSQPINQFQMKQAISQYQPLAKQQAFSSVLRVPPAAAAITPQASIESVETSGPGQSVTWNYLTMHHPEIVAQALAEVQAGQQPRAAIAGLASEIELTDMLKTNWSAEVSRLQAMRATSMSPAGVTSRGLPGGLSLTDQVTVNPSKATRPPSAVVQALAHDPFPVALPPRNLGSVWAGQSAFAYVFITAPADGYIEGRFNLNATNRHFRIVNAKAYTGEVVNGTPAVSLTIPGGQYQDVVMDPANPPSQISKAGFVAILARKGQLIAFTVAFEPVGLGMTPVGDNDATLELSGATSTEINILSPNAPVPTWTRTAAIHARFEGINFGVLGAMSDTAMTVFYDGTPCGRLIPVPVSITFHNAEQQARSVSITAELSHPLHMQGITVSVGPGERKQVPISLQIDSCPSQGVEYKGRLSYTYAGVVRQVEFGVTLYPQLLHWYKGPADVGSCHYSWDIYAQPDGTTRFAYNLRNTNLVSEMQLDLRFLLLETKIGGGVLSDGQNTVNTKFGGYTIQSSFVRDNYARLFSERARGQLRCHTPGF